MPIKKYKKRPIVIEALKWTRNGGEMHNFLSGKPYDACAYHMDSSGEHFYIDYSKVHGGLMIKTSEGDMAVNIGDYVIKEPFDKERMFYPCKPDIFMETYEAVT